MILIASNDVGRCYNHCMEITSSLVVWLDFRDINETGIQVSYVYIQILEYASG